MVRPSIGVHTHITNPLSYGYLVYLSTIESWIRLADQVVVVDGGSTDLSLDVLLQHLSNSEKVKIVSPAEAHWGPGDRWEWPQIAVNRQIGFESLETDWAIHVDADYIAPEVGWKKFRNDLQERSNCLLVSIPSMDYFNGRFQHGVRTRHWGLNKRLITNSSLAIGYGIERRSRVHLDYPIRIVENSWFIDPDINIKKDYNIGDYFESDNELPYEMFRGGHFFFTSQQLIDKCMRIERAIGRWRNALPRFQFEVEFDLNLRNLVGYETKLRLLEQGFPASLKRLIELYYEKGMIGGGLYQKGSPVSEKGKQLGTLLLRIYRWVRRKSAKSEVN